MEKMVIIPLEEYKRLVGRDIQLKQLDWVGIENWGGYNKIKVSKEIEEAKKGCESKVVCKVDHLELAWANLDGCDECGKTWLY